MIEKAQFILFLVLSSASTSNFQTLSLPASFIHPLIKLLDSLKIFGHIYLHLSLYQRFNAISRFVPYDDF